MISAKRAGLSRRPRGTRTAVIWLASLYVALLMGVFSKGSRADGPSAPPRPPAEERASFVLADPELTIELVAAEPDVASPVAIAWDEDGRLFVAEMLDYPDARTAGRIRMLEDRNGDGRYEHATIFAEGLPFPNSVLPCHGGLLVTAAPSLWYLRDADGDGKAEIRQAILTGFGEGNTQLRANGLTWGLDNWIYVANGRSDGQIRRPEDPPAKAVSMRRRDLRFQLVPRGEGAQRSVAASRIEAIAGFSQFGLPHDDWGRRYPSWNTVPIREVVLEQEWLDRNPYLAETSTVADILDLTDGGRIFPISPPQPRFNRESTAFFNASCGPIIERGGLLPGPYHGNAFVCEPLANLVHRRVLEPAGVASVARRVEQNREFLASSDPAFRPVNLANGPDGGLYVVDMYRELVEHPEFVPGPAREGVDFRRWHDRGRIWRIRPKRSTAASACPRLRAAGDPELVALLGHRNAWWRMTAQRLLVERGMIERLVEHRAQASSTPALAAAFENAPNARARVHALWTIMGADPAGVSAAKLAKLAADPDPRLRVQALCMDRYSYASLWLQNDVVERLADDPDIRVRFRAALALGARVKDQPGVLALLSKLAARDAADPWMRLAILCGLAESALEFISSCDQIAPSAGRTELLAQAAAIVGARDREAELARLFDRIADQSANAPGDALTLLAGLADGLDRAGKPLKTLVATPPAALKGAVVRLSNLWEIAATAASSNRALPDRMAALDVLTRGRPDLAERAIPSLLAASQPVAIQLAAARAVARVERPALAGATLELWPSLTLATRRELIAAIAGSPALAGSIVRALEEQIVSPAELDAVVRDRLTHLPDITLRNRASAVLKRFAPADRSAVIARYRAALQLKGDFNRGRAVFAKNCQTCHAHRGVGHRVGPDLAGVAGRGPEAILIDVLDPNRSIEADFMVLAASNRRGQVFSGLLAGETATTVKLRRAEGAEDLLLRSEIDEIRSTGRSLMPEGLEKEINIQDMADLIAFLRRGD